MPGHFDSIGFAADDESDLQRFVDRAMREGDQIEVIGADPGWGGRYVCWSPGHGVQLWLNVDEKGEVRGIDPHYAGRGRAYISLERTYDYDTAPPTGGIFAWVAVGTREETKAGFDLPAFARFYDMACDYDGNAIVQVAAFAHGAEVYDDEAAYTAATRRDFPDMPFAAESFLPIGMFDQEGRIPPATARLSGRVLEVARVTNAATERKFWAVLVKTVGMTVDVVADDDQLTGTPEVGRILAGSFWMSALPASGPRQPTLKASGPARITITKVGE